MTIGRKRIHNLFHVIFQFRCSRNRSRVQLHPWVWRPKINVRVWAHGQNCHFLSMFFRNPCQITEPRVVMRSWWIVGVAGCSPACFASSLELKQHVCARKTSHLLLKKSHLNLWHNLMDYCAALHAKFNANFYMMCLGPTHLDLKDQPFEHNCASFLNVTISSYNQLRNTEDNSQRPHKADGRKSSCDKSIY